MSQIGKVRFEGIEPNPSNSKLFLDDIDISRHVQGFEVKYFVGDIPKVVLHLIAGPEAQSITGHVVLDLRIPEMFLENEIEINGLRYRRIEDAD